MTLINYLNRVHFADGVLEEALRSELEHHGMRRPLIIAEDGHLAGATAERVFSSFPIRTRSELFTDVPSRATEAAARRIKQYYLGNDCDVLIAFGSNRAMDMAKVARIAIAYDEPIAALSNEEGGAQRISNSLPTLFSVPGVLGFASAISDYTRVRLDTGGQALLSSRHLVPEVTICDPTLTLGACARESACAAAGVLARGVDAYLAPGYNPPADGLALDALSRVVANIGSVLKNDDLSARREMMAAGLNSSMALQKGLCVVHAISNAIASVSDTPMDPSALGGVLIPRLVAFYGARSNGRTARVQHSLGFDDTGNLSDDLLEFVGTLPLATTLKDLGVRSDDLARAAELAVMDRAIGNGPRGLNAADVRGILEDANSLH